MTNDDYLACLAERSQTLPAQWPPGFDRYFDEVILAKANGQRVVYGADEFRARLAAASYSRAEMATVMATTLRELGYDVSAWTTLAEFTVRDEPEYTKGDLDEAENEGYTKGLDDGREEGHNDDELTEARDEGIAEGVEKAREAIVRALDSL